jgi:hypothetical protein
VPTERPTASTKPTANLSVLTHTPSR